MKEMLLKNVLFFFYSGNFGWSLQVFIDHQYQRWDLSPKSAGTSIATSCYDSVLLTRKHLVGGFNPSEKYESQLGWSFPTEWNNKKCSKQPTRHFLVSNPQVHRYCPIPRNQPWLALTRTDVKPWEATNGGFQISARKIGIWSTRSINCMIIMNYWSSSTRTCQQKKRAPRNDQFLFILY